MMLICAFRIEGWTSLNNKEGTQALFEQVSFTVLQFYSFTVLQFYSFIVLQFYSFTVL